MALGAAALLCAAPAAAGAAQPGQVLSRSALDPAATDGANAIAFAPAPGRVRVLDGRGRVVRDAKLSSACLDPLNDVTAVGGGQVVFRCSVTREPVAAIQPRRLDIATGEVGAIARSAEIVEWAETAQSGPGTANFWRIGTHGTYAHLFGVRLDSLVVSDWRTGSLLAWRTLGERAVVDLDSPTLQTELCAPMVRTPMADPFNEPDPYYDFVYGPPLALSIVDDDGGLELRRCGTTRAIALAERGAGDLHVDAGIAAWTTGRGSERPLRSFAYLPACSATTQLTLPGHPSIGYVDGALVVSTRQADTWEIRRIPLGGVCGRVDRVRQLELRAPGRPARTVRAVSGRFLDGPSGATVTLPAAASTRRLLARGGQTVRLVTGARAERVRWRVGTGPWRAARGDGRTWSVRMPDVRRAGTRSLDVDVRLTGGGGARFAGRLQLARPRS